MLENVVIPRPLDLEKLKREFKRDGAKKLHILSDFERTLTYAFVEGERVPSLISVLRSSNEYLGDGYVQKAQALSEKYHPIEIDSKIPAKEKKKAMEEWWLSHFDLLIKTGLNKKHLKMVAESGKMKLREGIGDLFDLLKKHEIPLVIMSASGLGGDVISMFLEKEDKLSSNIYIISNSFLWDEQGNAIGVKKPIINSLNKDETVVRDFPLIYEKVKGRRNVLLLGDNLEDVEMIKGFDYDNLIKIGFLNEAVNENLEPYKKTYDILILNDSSVEYIQTLLKEML